MAAESSPTIVWLRDDLRVADNPALTAAVERGRDVVVVYVLDDESPEVRPIGAASRWWLHHSLTALATELDVLGASLTLRRGPAEKVVMGLVDETGGDAVHWNRRYGKAREVDARLKSALKDRDIEAVSHAANLLFEPWTVKTGSGGPYGVFTPFWKSCLARDEPRAPLDAPTSIPGRRVDGDSLDDWGLLPTTPDWAGGMRDEWTPGSVGAHERLEQLVKVRLADYHRRDEPGLDATSQLSPHLRFGEVSPFEVWHRLRDGLSGLAAKNHAKFLSEIGWREFSYHLLFHHPDLATVNYRREFDAYPWNDPATAGLERWQKGRTGIPIVDAGMRQLWHIGWMHNRVRMITASFLTKNLQIDWRAGEEWFWDTLVDADEASNAASWQWVAGSGADAAPYFRVFNPVLQAQKFDPRNEYVAKWVPDEGTDDYPAPMVDLKESRQAALDGYEAVKAAKARAS
ncbi:deoxyribodipyrimidine photo-lyase type I [Microcella putealis]|uniref:Deoxyribodipyrimidine photo-lyase type I n=1 Tax=Microcella putealis TaxID=337005 RepID=A0A4Q7LRD2_9MICO|nr:deoxyribodipyrimidine photo-lyase [Microcella putealis]RZS56398.1 deoxyribodipyrimidine photo-lyase type I [Microcella putealis]TQM27116.1 deoxyribodipyrimidine photo-lyase type I [Microcella putealis]